MYVLAVGMPKASGASSIIHKKGATAISQAVCRIIVFAIWQAIIVIAHVTATTVKTTVLIVSKREVHL